MKIGLSFENDVEILRFGFDSSNFFWAPGEIESGKSYPSEIIGTYGDEYWLWGWLGFVVFFARATI